MSERTITCGVDEITLIEQAAPVGGRAVRTEGDLRTGGIHRARREDVLIELVVAHGARVRAHHQATTIVVLGQ